MHASRQNTACGAFKSETEKWEGGQVDWSCMIPVVGCRRPAACAQQYALPIRTGAGRAVPRFQWASFPAGTGCRTAAGLQIGLQRASQFRRAERRNDVQQHQPSHQQSPAHTPSFGRVVAPYLCTLGVKFYVCVFRRLLRSAQLIFQLGSMLPHFGEPVLHLRQRRLRARMQSTSTAYPWPACMHLTGCAAFTRSKQAARKEGSAAGGNKFSTRHNTCREAHIAAGTASIPLPNYQPTCAASTLPCAVRACAAAASAAACIC